MDSAWSLLILGVLLLPVVCLATAAEGAAESDWRHEYLTLDGVKLHYVTAGEGPLILFLHGFPEFWYAWRRQLPEFGKTHQAVALDMRGYNLSDKPAAVEEYAVPRLVADVKGGMDRLSPGRKAVLVGHDWGGVVAWVFAAMHPEYLDKLVIINAPHPDMFARELAENPKQRLASAYMHLFRSPVAETTLSAGDYAALKLAVFKAARRPEAFSEDDRRRYREAWAQPGALTGGLNYYRAARIGPLKPEEARGAGGLPALPPTKVPTLVLWGQQDAALLTGNLRGLEAKAPNVWIVRIPEGSHWVVHEEPERINREIRAFLGRYEAPHP